MPVSSFWIGIAEAGKALRACRQSDFRVYSSGYVGVRSMIDQVIPFPSGETDPLDRAGQEVLAKLRYAAGIAEQNTQQAVSLAHQSAMQLRVAEDKVARLEAELWNYKERAERAEGWLQRIAQEIDQSFAARPAEQPQGYVPPRHRTRRGP